MKPREESSRSPQRVFKDSSPIGYRGEGRGESTPHPSPSDTTYPDAGASDETPFSHLMGVCREVGLTAMGTNGSVLKALLKKFDCRELEAVIRGLKMLIDDSVRYERLNDCRSILPLNSAEYGTGIWADAVQCYYRTVNKRAPRQSEHDSTRIGSILKQLAEGA